MQATILICKQLQSLHHSGLVTYSERLHSDVVGQNLSMVTFLNNSDLLFQTYTWEINKKRPSGPFHPDSEGIWRLFYTVGGILFVWFGFPFPVPLQKKVTANPFLLMKYFYPEWSCVYQDDKCPHR